MSVSECARRAGRIAPRQSPLSAHAEPIPFISLVAPVNPLSQPAQTWIRAAALWIAGGPPGSLQYLYIELSDQFVAGFSKGVDVGYIE